LSRDQVWLIRRRIQRQDSREVVAQAQTIKQMSRDYKVASVAKWGTLILLLACGVLILTLGVVFLVYLSHVRGFGSVAPPSAFRWLVVPGITGTGVVLRRRVVRRRRLARAASGDSAARQQQAARHACSHCGAG